METTQTAVSKLTDAGVAVLDISIADVGRSLRNGYRKLKERKVAKQISLIERVIEAQRQQSA